MTLSVIDRALHPCFNYTGLLRIDYLLFDIKIGIAGIFWVDEQDCKLMVTKEIPFWKYLLWKHKSILLHTK